MKKRDLNGVNKVVRHICNNKTCCNPEHLDFGTHSDNMNDAIKNGHKMVKLDKEKVKEIKCLLVENMLTTNEMGQKYNVSNTTISKIKLGKSWKHVI